MDSSGVSGVLQEGNFLSTEEVIQMAEGIATVMETVHDLEVVHRDLKPHNLMRMADGSVKVFDFGAAKRKSDSESPLTSMLGTLV
jgi:eukaryotic-like serine/threonine-protein kinase